MNELMAEATLNTLLYSCGMEEYKGKLNTRSGVVIKSKDPRDATYRGGEVWAILAIRLFGDYANNILKLIKADDPMNKIFKLYKLLQHKKIDHAGVHVCFNQKNWLKLDKGQYACRYCFSDVSKALAYISENA